MLLSISQLVLKIWLNFFCKASKQKYFARPSFWLLFSAPQLYSSARFIMKFSAKQNKLTYCILLNGPLTSQYSQPGLKHKTLPTKLNACYFSYPRVKFQVALLFTAANFESFLISIAIGTMIMSKKCFAKITLQVQW